MANICIIDMTIETGTTAEAEGLREELQAAFDKAESENLGAYIGSDTRYIFDALAEQKGTTVTIGGWVRGAFDDYELRDCLEWLRDMVTIKKMNMGYKVLEDPARGEFDFDGETMKEYYLLDDDFPEEEEEEEIEDYFDRVEEIYRNKKVSRVVSMD